MTFLRVLSLIALACAACSNNSQPLPCANCNPPVSEIHNPNLDGGVDDAGNITQGACQSLCPKSLGCTLTKDDAGVVVVCGATCGC